MADIIYLVRHAAPPPAMRLRYWGRSDPGVDPAALDAVRGLAPLLWHKPDRLFASPLPRAKLTASRLAPILALPVESWPDLAEADFGLFEGMSFSEIAERHPGAAREWTERGDEYAFPGGEAIRAFLRRVADVWRRLDSLADPSALVVTHAGVIAVLACLFFGLPPAKRFIFRQDCGAVSAFVRKKDGTGWVLRYFNHGV